MKYFLLAGPVPGFEAAAPAVPAAAGAAAQVRVLAAAAVGLHLGGEGGPRAARRRIRLLQEVHQVGLRARANV